MKPPDGSPTRPLWAEEFSVQSGEDAYVQRRQFTKFLVLTSGGMLAGQVWIWAKTLLDGPPGPLPRVPIVRTDALPPGAVHLFTYPTPHDPCILVRTTAGRPVAYSQRCTHLACAVYYSAEADRLECPCHEGYFALDTGQVLQGPPPRPLPRIRLIEEDGWIVAVGVDLQEADT